VRWIGVAALLAFLVYAPAAQAHATLIASEPADGAMLAHAPATVRLTFNEAVSPLIMRLVGAPDGSVQELTGIAVEGTSVVVTLPEPARDKTQGTRGLSWRVISADGHPVGGTVVFSVGTRGEFTLVAHRDVLVRDALWAGKLALYLALFVGIGGAFFLAWAFKTWAPAAKRAGPMIGAVLCAGLIATPLTIGLQGLDALELPLSALGLRTVWETGLGTAYGPTALTAQLSLFAALFSLSVERLEIKRFLSFGALLGCGLALSLSGHASTADPRWLMRPLVFVHTIGVAFWIGALAPLALALRAGEGRAALAWFSRVIPLVLAPMLLAGLWLSFVQLGSIEALWTTAYGLVLCAKLAAVLVLLGLAGLNRFRLATAESAGSLVRSIGAEIILAVLILGLVAVWRFTPPPRALALAAAAPARVHIHTEALMADLTLEPARVGTARASIVVLRGDFSPFDAKEVALVLSYPAAGVEPIRRAATLREGVWQIDALPLPVAGRWQVRVDVLVSDFEKQMLEDSVEIRP
jgi:copper transport protein